MKCKFAGPIQDLNPHHVISSDLWKVECPECGARRKCHIVDGYVTYPEHPTLDGSTHDVACWKRKNGVWERYYWEPKERTDATK